MSTPAQNLEDWREGLEDEDELENQDQDELEDAVEEDEDSPEVREAKEAFLAAEKAFKEARAKEDREGKIKRYRELPNENQKDGWLAQVFPDEDARDAFVDEVSGIEREEWIAGLKAGSDDAFAEALRGADDLTTAELKDALADNPDRLKKVVGELETPRAELPVVEPAEDGTQSAPFSGTEHWAQSAMAEMTEVDVYAKEAIADVRKGRVNVSPEIREQLESVIARAESLPPGHSHATAAYTEAAGLALYAKSEFEASVPFGLGGIRSRKQYQDPQGRFHLLEIDGRGKTRDTLVENPVFAGEAGLIQDKPAGQTVEDFDPASITTYEQFAALGPIAHAKLREADPEKVEQFMRRSSQKAEEQELAMRTGSM